MAQRPPRVTSTRRQPTTRGGPRVTSRAPQQTTGRGRIVAQRNPWMRGTLAGMRPAGGAAGGGGAGAGVPAAPAPPQYSTANLPPDASFDQVMALLARQRDEQLAGLVQQRTSGLQDYGFVEGPNGALTFDPNNPFSKASQLKKAFDTNRRSTAQSMGSGGQLYSGAFQNAQDLVNRNQLQSEDAQQKALIGFLTRNTQQRAQALTGYETAGAQAYGDRVNRFSTNPLYDPAAGGVDPVTGSPPGAASPAAARRPLGPVRRPRLVGFAGRPFGPTRRS